MCLARVWVALDFGHPRAATDESAEGATSPTLADGGVPVADIGAGYPEADWDAVCGEMFLEP